MLGLVQLLRDGKTYVSMLFLSFLPWLLTGNILALKTERRRKEHCW